MFSECFRGDDGAVHPESGAGCAGDGASAGHETAASDEEQRRVCEKILRRREQVLRRDKNDKNQMKLIEINLDIDLALNRISFKLICSKSYKQ